MITNQVDQVNHLLFLKITNHFKFEGTLYNCMKGLSYLWILYFCKPYMNGWDYGVPLLHLQGKMHPCLLAMPLSNFSDATHILEAAVRCRRDRSLQWWNFQLSFSKHASKYKNHLPHIRYNCFGSSIGDAPATHGHGPAVLCRKLEIGMTPQADWDFQTSSQWMPNRCHNLTEFLIWMPSQGGEWLECMKWSENHSTQNPS